MHCRHFQSADGKMSGVVCGPRPRRRYCIYGRVARLLCDFELLGTKAGRTCDAPICDKCAIHIGPDRDLCRVRADVTAAQLTLPGVKP